MDKTVVLIIAIILAVVLVVLLIFRDKMNEWFNRNNEDYMRKRGKKQSAKGKKLLSDFIAANPQFNEEMIYNNVRLLAEGIVHNLPANGLPQEIIYKIRSNWQFVQIQAMRFESIDTLSFEGSVITFSANYTGDKDKLFLIMKFNVCNGMLILAQCDLMDAAERGF